MLLSDKLNSVDYQWFLVRTKPGHETELCAHIEREKDRLRNILEVYCPTHTKVYVRRGDNERRLPLFDGYVFVFATQSALVEFLRDNSSDAYLRYNRKRTPDEKATACTIPESQMRAFRDYRKRTSRTRLSVWLTVRWPARKAMSAASTGKRGWYSVSWA